MPICFLTVSGCSHDFTQLGDYCYGYIKQAETWHDAQATCKALEGFLAEPRTFVEHVFVKGLVQQYDGGDAWIGLTDKVHDGKWFWANHGDPLSEFTDWAPTKPDDGTLSNCVQLYAKAYHHWDDHICSVKKSFVCQLPVSDVLVG